MRLIDSDKLKISVIRRNGMITDPHISLETINSAPVIDAIPISWIDSYITDIKIGMASNNPVAIQQLVDDWKSEGRFDYEDE